MAYEAKMAALRDEITRLIEAKEEGVIRQIISSQKIQINLT